MAGYIILYVIVFILFILIGVMIYDSNRFVVSEYTVKTEKNIGNADILFISDLHCKTYGKENEKLINTINGLNADACFIAGDMITGHMKRDYVKAIPVLNAIREKMPVFYSMGNHEFRLRLYKEYFGDRFDDYVSLLNSIDVRMSDNETVSFNGMDITALSIEDRYYVKFENPTLPLNEVEDMIGKKNVDKFTVLLAHNPQYADTYSKWGADLVLAGHYHGGMMRLPFIGGVIAPSFKLFPKYSGGLYTCGNTQILVNKGLGAHTIPIRIFNPAEIIILHIVGEDTKTSI